MKRLVLGATLLLLSSEGFAAGFDCKKASTEVEKLICSDKALSQLDEDMSIAYRNMRAPLYGIERENYLVKQRNWLKQVRNKCQTSKCLKKVYQARISEINGQKAPLPNFRITKGQGYTVCEAFLKVLNRTPREELKACGLPNLTGSGFKPVKFTEVIADKTLQMDKKYYELINYRVPYETVEAQRISRYQSGFYRIYTGVLTIDGKREPVIQVTQPYSGCYTPPKGEYFSLANAFEDDWKTFSDEKKLLFAKGAGVYKGHESTDINLSTGSLDSGEFVQFNGGSYLINGIGLRSKNSINDWANKNLVALYEFDKKTGKHSRFERKKRCNYWYNY
ncbi:lysozyme inhibitor LprI family protein [Pseudoalteromonas luteoviolacea]|uniref:Lysozyme inhibitor LprI-like N-terminal domain-containing protein n=1 Tax=Pseudoalteromonas luteoviolacea S4054 TaxID=1129367 RepID=A0A0F6A6W4_9GAMM|nr:lysozyme inhibitor LprI family protein [Pseudoalteromonas luteoviolacea]AOT08179.1 hypothetical protein S4054249_10135 [Pseudoalteromonas luteoviolacea]AOT13096.1 hypothetical protein S40542_10135 [Pseudoalteromonas luteoviolacea]AOT18008.1 hypothetical protein S4054_10130 [Pseudoalteromonas luteoviolacea]KKE81164.1 hypothetical protein N479_23645 [Pseudoalteromonas luteoviolacea S4054]KZN65803.1 hypothetical protein N481_24990 [Pseudoalteromonas luteoviolacea S4047-1]